jgi:hypothetical protein
MAHTFGDTTPIEDPLAALERQLIAGFLAVSGHSLDELRARDDREAHELLAAASRYASERLSEIQARSHYLHRLHGHE